MSRTHKRRYKRNIWCQTVQILDWNLTQHYYGTVGCKPPMHYRWKSMSSLGLVIFWEDQSHWGRDWYDLPVNPTLFETALCTHYGSNYNVLQEVLFPEKNWDMKFKKFKNNSKATSCKRFVTFLGTVSVLVKFCFMTLHTFFTSHSWLPKAHSHSSTFVIIFPTNKNVGKGLKLLFSQSRIFFEWMTHRKEPKVGKWEFIVFQIIIIHFCVNVQSFCIVHLKM